MADEVQGLRWNKKRSLPDVNEHFCSEHNAEIRSQNSHKKQKALSEENAFRTVIM
ncbi:MAG: hypothetical protein IKY65_03745 [Rikenellaceae bacterium]|nr:hypothetical protein [Rikenellaceae bacterium]